MHKISKDELTDFIKSMITEKKINFALVLDELNGCNRENNHYEIDVRIFENSDFFYVLCCNMCELSVCVYVTTEKSINEFKKYFSSELKNTLSISIVDEMIINLYGRKDKINEVFKFCDNFCNEKKEIERTSHSLYKSYFLYPSEQSLAIKTTQPISLRLLTRSDDYLADMFSYDEDDYLANVFDYSVSEPVYEDCGVIGAFSDKGRLVGYLAYYGIDNFICDVSYIYVDKHYRCQNIGSLLLEEFIKMNREKNKVSYYSNADGEASLNLIKKFKFKECSERMEIAAEFRS